MTQTNLFVWAGKKPAAGKVVVDGTDFVVATGRKGFAAVVYGDSLSLISDKSFVCEGVTSEQVMWTLPDPVAAGPTPNNVAAAALGALGGFLLAKV